MDKEIVNRLANLAGEEQNAKPPKYNVPTIRFNGNEGKFRLIRIDEKGEKTEEDLTTPFNITILRKRKILSAFSPTASYFTNEYNNNQQKVSLFKNIDGTVTFEKSDYPTELRQAYQMLRTREVLYVLFNKEVCKLEVKGGSLADFYDFLQSLSEENIHTFEIITEINCEKTKNDTGFSYYKLIYKNVGQDVDLVEIEKHLTDINENLKSIDDYFVTRMLQRAKVSGKAEEDFNNFGKKVIDLESNDIVDGYPVNELKGDIPF